MACSHGGLCVRHNGSVAAASVASGMGLDACIRTSTGAGVQRLASKRAAWRIGESLLRTNSNAVAATSSQATATTTRRQATTVAVVVAAAGIPQKQRKRFKNRGLDSVVERSKKVHVVTRVREILAKQPQGRMTLAELGRHRHRLGLPSDRRRLVVVLRRFPAVFEVHDEGGGHVWFCFTPAADKLHQREQHLKQKLEDMAVIKIRKLLMMTHEGRISLERLSHIRRELGLPDDFRANLVHQYPEFFKVVDAPDGPALHLTSWDDRLAVTSAEASRRANETSSSDADDGEDGMYRNNDSGDKDDEGDGNSSTFDNDDVGDGSDVDDDDSFVPGRQPVPDVGILQHAMSASLALCEGSTISSSSSSRSSSSSSSSRSSSSSSRSTGSIGNIGAAKVTEARSQQLHNTRRDSSTALEQKNGFSETNERTGADEQEGPADNKEALVSGLVTAQAAKSSGHDLAGLGELDGAEQSWNEGVGEGEARAAAALLAGRKKAAASQAARLGISAELLVPRAVGNLEFDGFGDGFGENSGGRGDGAAATVADAYDEEEDDVKDHGIPVQHPTERWSPRSWGQSGEEAEGRGAAEPGPGGIEGAGYRDNEEEDGQEGEGEWRHRGLEEGCRSRANPKLNPNLNLNLNLPKGVKLPRQELRRLLLFYDGPPASPYVRPGEAVPPPSSMESERRCVAVVREMLSLTVEKRLLVDHLTHFRKEMRLPARIFSLILRHPELFYVSPKGVRNSVFLREAYDGDTLVEKDELSVIVEELRELVHSRRKRDSRMEGPGGEVQQQQQEGEEDEDEEYEGWTEEDEQELFEGRSDEDRSGGTSDAVRMAQKGDKTAEKQSGGVLQGRGKIPVRRTVAVRSEELEVERW